MVERGHEETGADTYPQQFKCPAAGRRRRPDGRLNRRVDVYCNPTATPASPVSTKQRKAFYPHGTVCMLLLKVRFSNNGDRSAGTNEIGRQMLDSIRLGQCSGVENIQCRQRSYIHTAEMYRFTCSLDPCKTSAGCRRRAGWSAARSVAYNDRYTAVVSAAGSLVRRLESMFPVPAGATATVAAKQQSYSSTIGFVRWAVMTKRDQLIACVNVRVTDDVTHVNTPPSLAARSEYNRWSVTPTSSIPVVDGKNENKIRKAEHETVIQAYSKLHR